MKTFLLFTNCLHFKKRYVTRNKKKTIKNEIFQKKIFIKKKEKISKKHVKK